ncbi:hypothetical protein M407DRAFT_20923 [Tulasnella calospora MUT 4182]|uniref:Methyltransferase domain-containing protein n=1 Tax=Tulasnella calospora MUT 4182 TaxID=1051891 RepID=A0A0C3L8A2_9AGAM|nr:hypothetical protein M407DRAFT_20923 [Tulasnella calospora MUT 4182]
MTSATSPIGLVKEVHGRLLQASDNDYYLPADQDEHSRLDMQHRALKLTMNSLYAQREQVKETLSRKDRRTALLDVGTGSGIWAIEMAEEFPNTNVTGIDIAPPDVLSRPSTVLPSNCVLKVADGTTEIKKYHEAFDIIHFRSAHLGMPNLARILLEDSANALIPGGLLQIAHCVPVVLKDDLSAYPVTDEGQPGFTFYPRAFNRVLQAHFKKARVKVEPSSSWHKWLEQSPSFERVTTEEVLVPLGRNVKPLSDTERRIRNLYSKNMANVIAAFGPLLLEDGLDDDTLTTWVQGVKNELGEEGSVVGYMGWRFTTATRTITPVEPLGSEPEVDLTRQTYDLYLNRKAGEYFPK